MPAFQHFPRVSHRLTVVGAVIAMVLACCHAGLSEETAAPALAAADREFFEKDVRPLLVKRCFECHGGTKAGGGLSLETADGWRKGGESGPAIVPGKPDESLLIEAVRYESLEMPPADHGGRLPDREIAVLTEWVARGAPDPRDGRDMLGGMRLEDARGWWSFQPVPTADTSWDVAADAARIDELLQREIDRHGLTPAQEADRRTLLRRLSYDLTGLPPTPEEVDAFVADPSPVAVDAAVERLLDSPQYGVQQGRRWLDVVRYADTAGENTDRPLPHAWRYRNWVIDAFNRDLPYDQFVRLQLAGDVIARDDTGPRRAEGIVATGYLAIARRYGHDISSDMHLTHEDVIDNLGRNFLGLSFGCARCHDHKYDPVTAADYYALYGIFDSTAFAFPGCEAKGEPRDMVPLVHGPEVEESMRQWQERVAAADEEKRRFAAAAAAAAKGMAALWKEGQRSLVAGVVAEGATVAFEQRLPVRRGEVLVLSVAPRDSHDGDTTLVEWTIRETGGAARSWSVADLVADLIKSNPMSAADGAAWSFLDLTDAPAFLTTRRDSNDGNAAIKAWRLGGDLAVLVNSADQQVMAWTTLAARSFFMHPGPQRPVAVAWTSPIDGEILLAGSVSDAHPGVSDGVVFHVGHVAVPEIGPLLADLGVASSAAPPDPGPPPAIPVAYAVVEGTAKNTRLHERGDPQKPGPEVPRRWLTVFGGAEVPADDGSGRRALADWVTGHPLAARVMVNRIWQWHFGHGLVRSANEFGSQGERPTHPELLEFLAAKFVQSGWSVKSLHRLILRTAAYRRAAASPGDDDPENRWLAHFGRRRLTAEELRDSLLAVAGRLDLSPGEAHPFPAERDWKYTQHHPFHAVYETNRRSAFLMVQRQRRHPFLASFDGADPNASTPVRQTTTVPTQALYFLNDPFFHEQAARFAGILLEAPEEARVRLAFRAAFQREPSLNEAERAGRLLAAYPATPAERWSALCRILLSSNEFVAVE
jgi:hypothetical protein